MSITKSKLVIAAILLIAALGLLFYFLPKNPPPAPSPIIPAGPTQEVIGTSVQGRKIEAFTFGTGEKNIIFVGGIHGGYEWNSVLLAYQVVDYLNANPNLVPAGLSVTVIPSLNPDGVFKIVGKEGRFASTDVVATRAESAPGRFNANAVDLNRNFDCKWKPESTWQNKAVSAGTAPFSEPEAAALRDIVNKNKPEAVVFWHSQAGAVYASQCHTGVATSTRDLMNMYAQAGGYPAVEEFDAYEVTGAAEDWLASIGIPAVTVELKTHETLEWDQNLTAVKALLTNYGK